jgi:small subunit ribosomal protein S6
MRNYEAVCVFRTDEDHFPKGQEAVKSRLSDLGATFVKEEDMGRRALAYPIKKQVQGHYYVYYVEMDPQQAHQVEEKVRHQEQLLRFLMVRRDVDEKAAPDKPAASPERAEAPPEQPPAAPEEAPAPAETAEAAPEEPTASAETAETAETPPESTEPTTEPTTTEGG